VLQSAQMERRPGSTVSPVTVQGQPPPQGRPRSAWVLLLPLLALPALWPLFANGLPRASDTALHLARLTLLHEHVLAGTLWPRWLPI